MASVSKELRRGIVYSTSAQKVWAGFKEMFDKINVTRIYHMQKEISDLTQGITSVSIYFLRLTDLWDEFESMIPLPGCDCERSRTFMEYLGLEKTMKFLMGLNETYSPQRSQVLMMGPTPGLNQVYSMIIHEESQRMNGTYGSQLGILGSGTMEGLVTANASNFKSTAYGDSIYCTYCHKQGHVREFCHRLIGYTSNFQFTNNKRTQGTNNNGGYRNNNNNTGHGNSNRRGHAPYSVLQKIPSLKKHVMHPCNCLVCPLAKQHRLPFPTCSTKSKRPFDLVHIDVWGPYRVCTYNGFKYFLTLVDDCTRMT